MNKKLPEILTEEEQALLLSICDKRYFTGYRNYLLIKTALQTGLRVTELINLCWDDINLKTGKIHVKIAKGKKHRIIYINSDLIEEMKFYIDRYGMPQKGLVFPNKEGKPLQDQYLRNMIKRRAEKVGIKKRVHFHLLRHTFLTKFYNATQDLSATQKIAGHTSIQSTEIYLHLNPDQIKNAAERMNWDYLRKGD